MNAPSASRSFLDAYRTAFETLDASVIADYFHYPFQITSDAGAVSVTAVPSREAWLPQLERLVGAYLLLGVHTADVLSLQVDDLTPQLGQATVHWGLVTGPTCPDGAYWVWSPPTRSMASTTERSDRSRSS